jgi:tetratricopeptide (TPR) repeat protein
MIRPRAKEIALDFVNRYHEETDVAAYHRAAWTTVRKRHLNPFQYRFALMQAEHAGDRTALGATRYRLGQYREALETLKQAGNEEKLLPANLAFQAMAEHQLDQAEAAQATLVRLRDLLRRSPGAEDTEARGLLLEAEELIETRTQGSG